MAQLMPLLLIVSCFSIIQTGFTFLEPAHPGSHGQTAVQRVCVMMMQVNCAYDVIVMIKAIALVHPCV